MSLGTNQEGNKKVTPIMSISPITVRPFDPINATATSYHPVNSVNNRIRVERQLDDPPILLEEAIHGWRSIPVSVKTYEWHIRRENDAEIIAAAGISIPCNDTRQLAFFGIEVAPDYRRQGLAHKLLATLVECATREERRLLMAITGDHLQESSAFMERLGAQRISSVQSQDPPRINLALKVKADQSETFWQVETAQVASYLQINMVRRAIAATRCHCAFDRCCD